MVNVSVPGISTSKGSKHTECTTLVKLRLMVYDKRLQCSSHYLNKWLSFCHEGNLSSATASGRQDSFIV